MVQFSMTTSSACRTSIAVLNPRTTQFRIVMFRIGWDAVPSTAIPVPVVPDDVIDTPSIVVLLDVIMIGPDGRCEAEGEGSAPARPSPGTALPGVGSARGEPPNGMDQTARTAITTTTRPRTIRVGTLSLGRLM